MEQGLYLTRATKSKCYKILNFIYFMAHSSKEDYIENVVKELRRYYRGTKRIKAHINVGDCPKHD